MLFLLNALAGVDTALARDYPIGSQYDCAPIPEFVKALSLRQPTAIDTSQVRFPGLLVREMNGTGAYQHPSWTTAGHVGMTVRDRPGNIYLHPFATLAPSKEHLAKRNTLYKISTFDGIMRPFLKLEANLSEDEATHPFGIVGLAYDCYSGMLYVSSVYQSKPFEERGVIYQVESKTGKILDKHEGIDVLSLVVFGFEDSKRLYMSGARSSSLYSIELDNKGGFVAGAKPRLETSLDTLRNGTTNQIKQLRFTLEPSGKHMLRFSTTDFSFRLTAQNRGQQVKLYEFELDLDSQKLNFIQTGFAR